MKKSSFLALLTVLSILAMDGAAQTNYGTITFTNKSGDVISNAVVTKVEANKLTYRIGVGGGVVRLVDLPEGLRARFVSNPDPAAVERPGTQTEAERKHFEETKAKAEKGDAEAQYELGFCYDAGSGVPQDAVEALKWYRKAAEKGFAKAQCNLGNCYENGDGVTKDAVEAVNWYRKAAEQGDAQAQAQFALCYIIGTGVPADCCQEGCVNLTTAPNTGSYSPT